MRLQGWGFSYGLGYWLNLWTLIFLLKRWDFELDPQKVIHFLFGRGVNSNQVLISMSSSAQSLLAYRRLHNQPDTGTAFAWPGIPAYSIALSSKRGPGLPFGCVVGNQGERPFNNPKENGLLVLKDRTCQEVSGDVLGAAAGRQPAHPH